MEILSNSANSESFTRNEHPSSSTDAVVSSTSSSSSISLAQLNSKESLRSKIKLTTDHTVTSTTTKSKKLKSIPSHVQPLQDVTSVVKEGDGENKELFCICRRSSDEDDDDDMMIECDVCNDWLHGRCINLTQRLAADIEVYVCPRCVTDKKSTIYKKRKNNHRHDYSDGNAVNKPTQAGTKTFIQQLLQREYPCALENNIVKKIAYGNELTFEYFEKNGMECPLLIENKAGLGFLMPTNDEINLSQIQDIVGGEYKLGVIDVERQEEFAMSIKELNEYFDESNPREKVYNLISFEISKTKLTEKIEAPNVVHQISWVSNGVWPNPVTAATSPRLDSTTPEEHVKPEVQKYCLISAENSYTDFHIDFGGSSVWYHLVKGDKIFYLIEPSEENLRAYENWYSQKNHNEIFLADRVKNCYTFKIKQGSTILLPSGWIHAVYTPFDSLVFGGNFLQSYSIPMQIKVYEMELRLNTHEKYRFPAFETLQWYAAKFYTQKLKEINLNKKCITNRLYHGLKYLNNTLKRWVNSKDFYQAHDHQIPRKIDGNKLVVIMSKELAKAENLLKSNNLFVSTNENSLKLKIKLPTSLNSAAATSSVTNNSLASISSNISINNDTRTYTISESNSATIMQNSLNGATGIVKKKKEVLNYGNSIDSIKLENDFVDENTNKPNAIEPEKKERIVMKLKTKPNSLDHTSATTATATTVSNEAQSHDAPPPPPPIKLKLKISSIESAAKTVTYINPSETKSEEIPDDFLKKTNTSEDDEMINELKNSYTDGDFVYPSLKKETTTKRKSNDSAVNEDETNNTENKKSARKRKLKPHAVQYLMPKEEAVVKSDQTNLGDITKKEENSEKKPKTPKKMIDRLIEKNLKPTITTTTASDTSITSQKNQDDEGSSDLADKEYKNEESNDVDYDDDEYNDDEDEDFKLKCKNNLKLSKKIKKSQMKHQKKLDEDTTSPGKQSKKPNAKVEAQKPTLNASKKSSGKKGLATAKQRLGKLLKLNRIVNI